MAALDDTTSSAEPSPIHSGPNGLFAFIHINRTGGTSIGHALNLPRKQHLTVQEVIAISGRENWEQAFRFTIVRNPWDKVASHYKHRVRKNHTGLRDHPIPFAEWVAATYGPEKRLPYYEQPKMFQPQVDWLEDSDGRVDLNLVGRFEDLRGAFQQIAARIGITGQLPHLNASDPSDYRTFYDDRTAETVSDWFKRDIARFAYRFEGRP